MRHVSTGSLGITRKGSWINSALPGLNVGQNQWYHFRVGEFTPILGYFSGDWDVHGANRDFDPWPGFGLALSLSWVWVKMGTQMEPE